MKNTLDEFIPFEHKNVDYINGSLALARQQRQSGNVEGLMASSLIYANLAEYLTRNLLENLQHMFYLISYKSLNGVFFIKNKSNIKKKTPRMLGQLIDTLSNYEFPDSVNFISLLKNFSETRASIFHRLLSIPKEELHNVDQQLAQLRDMAEEILDKYNTITQGIGEAWFVFVNSQISKIPPANQPELNLKNSNQKSNNSKT